ncbi:hypothetical protein HDU98_004944 [Podochytrium sp. JEL0797]|nr:hypothetical protein HDU98_004944 [Podochytrium sp. JEL0797]
MPIGDSLLKRNALTAATLLVDAIPILAACFSIREFYRMIQSSISSSSEPYAHSSTPPTLTLNDLFQLYLHLEAAFLVYFCLQHIRLQAPIPPSPLSPTERSKIFYRALDTSGTRFREFFAPVFTHSTDFRKTQLRPDEFHLIQRDNFRDCFFHGIGCGLFPYALFITELTTKAPHSPIFLIELPHVSMRFVDRVASMTQTVSAVEKMLDTYGHSKCMVVGHSLGSASAAWMIKNSKYATASILLDPIVFLTHHPSLAYNFVHRHPGRNCVKKANEILMHWLCARELHISYTISRHFVWHESILWADDLPSNHHVVLSRMDMLVDAQVIEEYLVNNGVSHTTYDVDHGEFLFLPHLQTEIVTKIAENARLF